MRGRAFQKLFAAASNYTLTDPGVVGFPVSTDATGRTAVDPTILGKTLILVVDGQSNAGNHDQASYTVVNTGKVQNLSIYDGRIYPLIDPLLGCTYKDVGGLTGSNWQGRLGDQLINAGWATRIIFVPLAVAGSTISLHAAAGSLNHRIGVTCRRLNAVGLLGLASAVLWQQGESDNTAGTSQGAYTTGLNSVISAYRGNGCAAPFFVAQCTRQNDNSTSAAVRAAQAASVNHGTGIWLGPDSDTLGAGNRDSSNAHFNATGSDANATLWKTALGLYGPPFA